MPIRIVLLIGLIFGIWGKATSQAETVVIVVMGSSTAEGAGAWPKDSSWVSRLTLAVKRNPDDNADTVVHNLGLGGTTTYVGRENGFVPPQGYAGPDPERNINKALSLNADIIVVNYPSNDVANNMSTATTMENYQKYHDLAAAAGVKIYFLTTQPRDQLSYDQKLQIRAQKDVIISTFPNTHINVWDILVAGDGLNIHSDVSAGDGIHVNNVGHRRIFEAVAASSYLGAGLPVRLTKFTATQASERIDLNWETASESNNSHFVIERSNNNRDFHAIAEVRGKGNSNTRTRYSYPDKKPNPGKNYYRLKQVDLDGKTSFSQVVYVMLREVARGLVLYPVPATSELHLNIAADKKEFITVSIFDHSGHMKESYPRKLEKGQNNLNFSVNRFPPGNYLMQIKGESSISNRSFIKL
ncbi:MAG TPA: GDSL-type esterase/lipase family protein [Chitinophagaceae bacterium]|nr:GDSL-type esterase/lipase family protein [Chitinophagaceae bacterium]